MLRNDFFILFFLLIFSSNCYSQNRVEILNNDFLNSKTKTKYQIVQECVFGDYDEFRFETSLLKIDENNILNEYFYYFDDNVLKCLAIYQFPKGDEINGVLLINKNRNISNQVIIKVSDQENFYPTVYVDWHPNHEFLLEENGLEKVEVKINDFSNEIILPQETMIIDLYYQGKSKEQKLDFEDFLYLNHLKTIFINDFSNPIVNDSNSFNIICK